jgi:A/G-specific adenine glycosylase
MKFSNLLIQWYLQNKRDLPWRNSNNPYNIWLSEIILQQTKVAQGLPYFNAFLNNFPTVFDLANASEQQVLKLWQGLGYYSRARNLHKTAQIIAFQKQGIFPDNYKDLLTLVGVGEYTAAAIASFAYNESVAVVDGNVFRVLSRYFNIDSDISSAKTKKEFQDLATLLLPPNDAATFNQAIMEFGALHCVPKNPNCSECIFNVSCAALQYNKVAELPFKSKKIKPKNRFLNYLVFQDSENKTIVSERKDKGIWQGLYEFTLIETELDDQKSVIISIQNQDIIANKIVSITNLNPVLQLHKLTHQNLYIRFWKINVEGEIENGIDIENLKKLPFPIVIYNFIETNMNDEF